MTRLRLPYTLVGMTNPLNYKVTSRFGVDRSYTVNGVYYKDIHDGVDFAYPQGTVVTLPPDGSWDGTVIVAQLDQHGGGWVDVRADSDGGVARFLHFSRIDAKVGQKVKSYDVLGLSGGIPGTWGAGLSDGSHLHIGLFVNGVATDPLPWLQKSYSPISEPEPEPQPPTPTKFYTLKSGGWRSQVIEEIINAGIWSGTWKENQSKFLELNGLPPEGGYKAGMQVRIASEPQPPQVDSIKIPDPVVLPKPIQPQPEVQPANPTMPTVSIEKPIIFTEPVQPQLPEPSKITMTATIDSQIQAKDDKIIELKNQLNEVKKQPEIFTFNKLIIGIVSGRNYLANSAFFLGLAGLYAFYNQNQEEINLALGLASQAVSIIYVLFRKYLEQQKYESPEKTKSS